MGGSEDKQSGGPFLSAADAVPIPPLIELPRLLSAAERVTGGSDSDEDLRCFSRPAHRSAARGRRPPSAIGTAISQLRSFRTRMTSSMPSCGRPSH